MSRGMNKCDYCYKFRFKYGDEMKKCKCGNYLTRYDTVYDGKCAMCRELPIS